MPKGTKSVKRRAQKYRPKVTQRARCMKRTLKRKKQSRCDVGYIKEAWDTRRTPRENMEVIGLAFNPNEVVKIKPLRRQYIDTVSIDEEEDVDMEPETTKADPAERFRYKKPLNQKAAAVIPLLEEDVKKNEQIIKDQHRKPNMLDRDVELCIYLLERYDDDYTAMCRDAKNIMQYTPKQLAKKIKQFKESSFFKAFV